MTRSIFDPTGGETEHSGNVFTGPSADNDSHMPTDIVDGKVSEEEVAEHEVTAKASEEDPVTTPEATVGEQVDETRTITPPM